VVPSKISFLSRRLHLALLRTTMFGGTSQVASAAWYFPSPLGRGPVERPVWNKPLVGSPAPVSPSRPLHVRWPNHTQRPTCSRSAHRRRLKQQGKRFRSLELVSSTASSAEIDELDRRARRARSEAIAEGLRADRAIASEAVAAASQGLRLDWRLANSRQLEPVSPWPTWPSSSARQRPSWPRSGGPQTPDPVQLGAPRSARKSCASFRASQAPAHHCFSSSLGRAAERHLGRPRTPATLLALDLFRQNLDLF
jgi:hypothetical protein